MLPTTRPPPWDTDRARGIASNGVTTSAWVGTAIATITPNDKPRVATATRSHENRTFGTGRPCRSARRTAIAASTQNRPAEVLSENVSYAAPARTPATTAPTL